MFSTHFILKFFLKSWIMSVSMAIELNYMRHLHIPAIGFKFLFFRHQYNIYLLFYLVCIIIYEHKNHHWWYELFDEDQKCCDRRQRSTLHALILFWFRWINYVMSIRIIMFILSKVKCHLFFLLEIGQIGSWRNKSYGFLE